MDIYTRMMDLWMDGRTDGWMNCGYIHTDAGLVDGWIVDRQTDGGLADAG